MTPAELTELDRRVAVVEKIMLDRIPNDIQTDHILTYQILKQGRHSITLRWSPTRDYALGYEIWEKHKRRVYIHRTFVFHPGISMENVKDKYWDWYNDATLPDLMRAVVEAHEQEAQETET